MKTTISVEGMSCDHCKMTIKKNLEAMTGVLSVDVDLEEKVVEIEATVPRNDLKKKIAELGYTPV